MMSRGQMFIVEQQQFLAMMDYFSYVMIESSSIIATLILHLGAVT